MPGDSRLPRTTPRGLPWPAEAGALLVKARFLPTREGQETRAIAQAFGPDYALSIGFKVRHARQRGTVRHIDDLDCYEASGVLHGANELAGLLSVKAGQPAGLERKATPTGTPGALTRVECGGGCGRHALLSFPVPGRHGYLCPVCVDEASTGLADALARYRADRPDRDEPDSPVPAVEQTECSACGQPAGIVAAEIPPGATVLGAECTAEFRDDLVDALARFGERELGAEETYLTAAELEQAYTLLGDGTLEPAADDPTRGAAWTRTTRGGWGSP